MIVFAQPTSGSIAAFLPLVGAACCSACGRAGTSSAACRSRKRDPYTYVRHPLYVGGFLWGLAFALMSRSVALVAV